MPVRMPLNHVSFSLTLPTVLDEILRRHPTLNAYAPSLPAAEETLEEETIKHIRSVLYVANACLIFRPNLDHVEPEFFWIQDGHTFEKYCKELRYAAHVFKQLARTMPRSNILLRSYACLDLARTYTPQEWEAERKLYYGKNAPDGLTLQFWKPCPRGEIKQGAKAVLKKNTACAGIKLEERIKSLVLCRI
jgi:hypothetical protein